MRSRRSTPSCHDTWEKLLSMGLCLIPIIKRFSLFSPVVRQLQGNLDEGIWAHLLFLDELFPIVTEFMDIHVQILHQPDQNNKLWQKLFSYVCVCVWTDFKWTQTSGVCQQKSWCVSGSLENISSEACVEQGAHSRSQPWPALTGSQSWGEYQICNRHLKRVNKQAVSDVPYMYLRRYSVHCTRTIPSKGECSHTTPQQPSSPTTNWQWPELLS